MKLSENSQTEISIPKFFIFPQLFKALVWWRPTAAVVGALFRSSRPISIAFV